jgi:hypothetical protein
MKYIVKNCPAKYYEFIDDEQKCFLKNKKCKHISDCLLKQIVEKCKSIDAECFDQWCFANYILESLESEEVNEE